MDGFDDFTAEAYLAAKRRADKELADKVKEEEAELDELVRRREEKEEDALKSTKNALRIARETEDVGKRTMDQLKQQGEVLDKTEKRIVEVDANAESNYNRAKEVKQYDTIFGIPWTRLFTSKKKRIDKELKKEQKRLQQQEAERVAQQTESERLQQKILAEIPEPVPEGKATGKQTQIDQNLDEIKHVVSKIAIMGRQMDDELDRQLVVIDTISPYCEHAKETLARADKKIKKFT